MGGHDFDRRPGNQALCDQIVELSGSSQPRICLLPTASGDPEEQIARFRRAFGERGCNPSEIALFRLGAEPVELRAHLSAQDAIYVCGGSLVNLLAIWRAHGLDAILREAWETGILICWSERRGDVLVRERDHEAPRGSRRSPAACASYRAARASTTTLIRPAGRLFLEAVASGAVPAGFGLDDQIRGADRGARPWQPPSRRATAPPSARVVAEGGGAEEIPLEAEGSRDRENADRRDTEPRSSSCAGRSRRGPRGRPAGVWDRSASWLRVPPAAGGAVASPAFVADRLAGEVFLAMQRVRPWRARRRRAGRSSRRPPRPAP